MTLRQRVAFWLVLVGFVLLSGVVFGSPISATHGWDAVVYLGVVNGFAARMIVLGIVAPKSRRARRAAWARQRAMEQAEVARLEEGLRARGIL